MRERWQDQVYREMQRWKSSAGRARIAAANRRKAKSSAWRAANSAALKLKYTDTAFRERMAPITAANGKLGGRPRKTADTASNRG
jgi:hypothetical protein